MTSLTEEPLSKLSKQELIAMMLQILNEMKSSDTKFAEEVRKFNESFEQLKSDLAITKMLIASSTITLLSWRGNAGQMLSILAENVWRLWVYPLHSWIMSLKKPFCKIFDKVGIKINDRGIESCHLVDDDDDDELFCGMVDRRKAFNLISSQDHCERSSPSHISDTLQAGFEPVQNLSSGCVE